MSNVLHIFLTLLTLLTNRKYSARRLEALQRGVYGDDRSIMESRHASEMGAKIGVTMTRTRDTETFIATNYNAGGDRRPSQSDRNTISGGSNSQ